MFQGREGQGGGAVGALAAAAERAAVRQYGRLQGCSTGRLLYLPGCGHRIGYNVRVPCYKVQCPMCGAQMTRE